MRWLLLFLLSWIPAYAGTTLSLDEALRLAESRSPQLAAQRASAEAAGALVGSAGQNPDPKLIVGIENVPVEGGNAWSLTADTMTMRKVGVMQEFMRGAKLDARIARQEAEARRETAIAGMQLADLRRDVAVAWFERFYAMRSREVVDSMLAEARLQAEASTAELAAGRGSAADALAARALRATLADRQLEIDRVARRSQATLTRWLGGDAAREPVSPPQIRYIGHHAENLEAGLETHPHLAMYGPMVEMARAELRMAEAGKQSDWSVEVTYAQRGAAYENMASIMFRMDLPLFQERRQDRVVDSRRRSVEQAQAQADEARLRHVADIRAGLADWEVAKERLERQRADIIPYAEERARLAQSAYAGGRADLASVFEARRMLLDALLAAINAEAELARAWAQLAFLVPEGSKP
jgi:outer membrane protein TolC